MCIPGLGGPSNRPKPRVLGTSFFGYVPDAYSMKTPTMPSERAMVESAADNSSKTNIQVRRFWIQRQQKCFFFFNTRDDLYHPMTFSSPSLISRLEYKNIKSIQRVTVDSKF